MDQLIDLLRPLLTPALVLVAVIIGFCMGWKAARPEDTLIKPKPFDPGPTNEEEGDIFRDALEPVEKERGISTL